MKEAKSDAKPLQDLRVLVVEDEYFIASDLKQIFTDAGARAVRLSGNAEDALAQIARGAFEVALVDVNLRGEHAYSVADALKHRRIPFAFLSGYDRGILPTRFDDTPLWEKPYDPRKLVQELIALL